MMQRIFDFLLVPRPAHTLAAMRIATGAMIAYVHSIWLMRLDTFFGPNALVSNAFLRELHADRWKWTYLAQTDSLTVAWVHEAAAILAGLCMCVGFASRWSIPLAWLLSLMTAHRLAPFLFGLDQVVLMLAMYLCIGDSGSVWSVDAIRKGSKGDTLAWNNTLAMRLIQLHLCVIYLFGGLGKLRGWMWWDGSAMWFSAASYEYQSVPLTWIGSMPLAGSILTHLTLAWEFSYAALIWPSWTRRWMLAIAMGVHGGIAIFLGMITFGAMMIVANLAFVEPSLLQRWASQVRARAAQDRKT